MIHEKCKKRCCVCADNTSFHLKFVAQTSRVRFYEKISEPHHKKKKKKHTKIRNVGSASQYALRTIDKISWCNLYISVVFKTRFPFIAHGGLI